MDIHDQDMVDQDKDANVDRVVRRDECQVEGKPEKHVSGKLKPVLSNMDSI